MLSVNQKDRLNEFCRHLNCRVFEDISGADGLILMNGNSEIYPKPISLMEVDRILSAERNRGLHGKSIQQTT